ncbi:hypothetical protein L7F22_061937 [Adiantum nelumboides]|nr:hypothetical protein [Adiantum nelumboides]
MSSILDFGRAVWEKKPTKLCFCVVGVMSTLVIYGVMQEKIMRVPYGDSEFFRYSLFIVLCNRLLTVAVSAILLLALKYVSFPVQTLAKCAKMIPVMVWGTLIMQKKYIKRDYFLAVLVTVGCAVFILYPAGNEVSPYAAGRESTFWGVLLMAGYLGFDGFTSTFQDKLFKGYSMDIYNQVFYVTLCSSFLSATGLWIQGQWFLALDFLTRHPDCLYDIMLLSMVATASQFFISYTIRTFGALIFSIIMTTRQLTSILLSCLWFAHPLSWQQLIGGLVVFCSLYFKSLFNQKAKRSNSARIGKVVPDIERQAEDDVDDKALVPQIDTTSSKGTFTS